jgi:hypothetical protein
MSFLDKLFDQSIATDLATESGGAPVNVGDAPAPNPGDVLTATDATHATWQPGGGGSSGGATDIANSETDPINVSDAPAGLVGQSLVINDPNAPDAVWRSVALSFGGVDVPPGINQWTVWTLGGPIGLPATPIGCGAGIYATADVNVFASGDTSLFYEGVLIPGGLDSFVTIPAGTYIEWFLVDMAGTSTWIPRGSSGPSSGGGAGGGLEYGDGTDPDFGQWVIAANNITSTLPTPTENGQRVGVYVGPDTTGVSVTSSAYLYIDRVIAVTAPLRPGGWYEWTSITFGEDFRWVPHGGSGHEAKAALELSDVASTGTVRPNQWVLAANGDVVSAPSNPMIGDCLGIYVNGTSASVMAATGQSIVSPDGTTIVASPGTLTLPGNTYYEWIWVQSAAHWKPKNYLDSAGGGLIRTGKTLAVGANADGSIAVNADDIKVGILATDAQHGTRGGGTLHAAATGSAAGFMSAADKIRLDSMNLVVKGPVRLVATANVALSGTPTIDSILTVAGDRVLLTAQTDQTANGIYVVAAGAWARASDCDSSAEFPGGALISVNEGSTYNNTLWFNSTNDPVVLGTTNIVITQCGGLRATNNPSQITAGATPTPGVAPRWAAEDHVHIVPAAVAPSSLPIASSALAGIGPGFALADHVHAMPSYATQGAGGFLLPADKIRLDSMSLAFKAPVRLVSIADLGVILSTGGNTTIDGVLTATGDRILVTAQTLANNNGIWIVVSGSGWTRATDTDTTAKFSGGSLVYVNEGTTYKDTLWTLTTNDPIVLGTTSLQIAQIGGQKATALPVDVGKPSVAANNGTAAKWSPEDHSHQAHSLHNGFNGFRVSNNAASSIPTDGSSSTVYLVPHSGYRISLSNNGLDWYPVTPSSNPSVAVTGQTAGIPCDVFAVFGSLTGVTLALLPWTNATTRATALVQTNGVWVKSGVPTQRYVGTILPDSATTFSHVSAASGAANPICGIWNQANRIRGAFTWSAAFDTWTIPSANTWQQINAQASAKVQYVQGQSLDVVRAEHIGGLTPGGGIGTLGIGIDSLTVPSGLRMPGASNDAGLSAVAQQLTAAGAHNLNALAFSTSATAVFQGAHGAVQGGITAELWY